MKQALVLLNAYNKSWAQQLHAVKKKMEKEKKKKAPQNPDQPKTPQLKEGRNSGGSLRALHTLPGRLLRMYTVLALSGMWVGAQKAQHGAAAASEQTRAQGNSMLTRAKDGNRFPDGPLYLWLQ